MDAGASDIFSNSFKTATKEDWLKAARLELEGADPLQKLTFEKGNLTILPYYDPADATTHEHFRLGPSTNEFLGPRAWYNMPCLDVTREPESNQKALSDLNSGADGIILNLKTNATDISALLEKIEWPFCAISFTGNVNPPLLKKIQSYAFEKKYDVSTLTGCIFHDKLVEEGVDQLKGFAGCKSFHPLGMIVERKESPAEEIAQALAQVVKQMNFLLANGFTAMQSLKWHAFHVQIDEDFFLSIAKLKALRYLWRQLAVAYDDSSADSVFIHASSPAWNKKEYQPNANMLKSTTAALSAILGGCDALTVFAEDSENAMMTRVARNVSSILREESHLSRVADPTAGSYYLESLTDQLATKAWKKFEELTTAY